MLRYLWWNDIEQVTGRRIFLRKNIVLLRFKRNAKHVDDEGTWRQIERDAVLSQELFSLVVFFFRNFRAILVPMG